MEVLAKGIDVSAWQGRIDWDKVKASGIEFAVLRCGYGSDAANQDDEYFEANASECERLGIPYGIYLYSYAKSVEMARSEARHVIRLLSGKKPLYPVYYDLEDANTTEKCGKELILEMAKAFTAAVEEAGYIAGIYSNKYWNETYLTDGWYDTKPRWIAQYAGKCTYGGEYGMWQYSNSGTVSGIDGDADLDYAYIDYPAISAGHYNGSGDQAEPAAGKSVAELAAEVIEGRWGNGEERKKRLTEAGYDYAAVQKEVNRLVAGEGAGKSVAALAAEVIEGRWGNGEERKKRLTEAGYDYAAVQKEVNRLVAGEGAGKSVAELAAEVIKGRWGNGEERKKRLAAAGYDYAAVQKEVNRLLK